MIVDALASVQTLYHLLLIYYAYARRRHYVFKLSIHSSARPSVYLSVSYQTYEHCILKVNEPILIQISTSIARVRAWCNQLWGSGGQRSRSYEAKDRFGGLVEASSCLPWVSSFSNLTPCCDDTWRWMFASKVRLAFKTLANEDLTADVVVSLTDKTFLFEDFCCLLSEHRYRVSRRPSGLSRFLVISVPPQSI